MLTNLANLITRVFDPLIVGLLTVVLIINATPLDLAGKLGWFGLVLLIAVAPVLSLLFYEMKKGKISENANIREQKIGQRDIVGECGWRAGGTERSESKRMKDRGSWVAKEGKT